MKTLLEVKMLFSLLGKERKDRLGALLGLLPGCPVRRGHGWRQSQRQHQDL